MLEAGEQGVAADRRDHLAVEHGDARRLLHPGQIHVEVLADDLAGLVGLAHEADNVVEALDGDVHRIAAERPEAAGDLVQALRVEFLIADRHRLVDMQRPAHLLEGGIVGVGRQVDADDLGTDRAGRRPDLDALEPRIAIHRPTSR